MAAAVGERVFASGSGGVQPWASVRVGEADGYADGPAFQAAMDRLLDSIRAAMKRT